MEPETLAASRPEVHDRTTPSQEEAELGRPTRTFAFVATIALSAMLAVAACGGSGSSVWKTATSASANGGMDALVTAAKAEGTINVIAVPPEWANYKGVLAAFKAKYGLTVVEQGLDFNSQQEIDAANATKGTDKAPDVFDITAAIASANAALLTPYQVAAWADIPANLKESTGLYVSDYTGFMSIGCDTKKVPQPATVADLLKADFKGKVALNGNPKTSGSGLNGVVMAALANGGSADDIKAGVDFFNQMNTAGNLLPVDPTPTTIASGQTPCVIDWEYNNAALTADLVSKGIDWKVTIPSDAAPVAAYYLQAVNKDAPHPASARLWEEFLYTPEAQNEWLKGFARPVLLDKMVAAGTVDQTALGALGQASGTPVVLTQDQVKKAADYLAANWSIELP
jgi:putative spermidine/putrescine transport system substrate-binding protein